MITNNRISLLESVRGLMAIWVVIGHTILHSGYLAKDLGPLKLLATPTLAVDVFIILSGFVIFFLLDNQRTPYSEFIIKRWFRIVPMFFATLLLSFVTVDWQVKIIETFPWKNQVIQDDLNIHLNSIQYLTQHLIAHVLLIHGVIADEILPGSAFAFVGQAWSISVEWQFYLIAPFLYTLILKKKYFEVGFVIVFVCIFKAINYGSIGFAINQAAYFLVGIISYYAWKFSESFHLEGRQLDLITLAFMALAYILMSRSVSLIIWCVVLSCVITEKRNLNSPLQGILKKILNWYVFQWLGKISYSVYLTHMLIFYCLTVIVRTLNPNIEKLDFAITMLPAVILATLAISSFTYKFLECPGIELGKKCVEKFKRKPVIA